MSGHRPILTITGSDPTGGSGVQADITTITALGGYAVSAITSVTMQNTLGIQDFCDLDASVVEGQIEAIVNDVQPTTVKVGMIRSREVLDVVIRTLQRHRPLHVVYAPVVQSTQGDALMSDALMGDIERRLLPLCTLTVCRRRDAELLRLSGHVQLLDDEVTHGLAGAFASAVAYHLNEGVPTDEAIRAARTYVSTRMARQQGLRGRSNELYREFMAAVEQHFRQYSDVAYYADLLNVSANYLAQVTRRIARQSPKALIDDRVAAEAERLLATTSRTVQEIAYELGFTSQAHFARFFRKQRGATPSEYRLNT